MSHESLGMLGYGKSYASFGEIVQGRLSDEEDFLITLPVDVWTTCEITCLADTTLPHHSVRCELDKSRTVVLRMLEILANTHRYLVDVAFTSHIPIGKGLSSSTADMLAVVRAFQEMFGVIVSEPFISSLFTEIEPHDALHYYMSVIYNHRKGKLLEKLHHIPQYKIVGVDSGGVVDTATYNQNLLFSDDDKQFYDQLYRRSIDAFSRKDDIEIAKIATESTVRQYQRTGNPFLSDMLGLREAFSALGVVTAHSGTFTGLLFPKNTSDSELLAIQKRFSHESIILKTLEII